MQFPDDYLKGIGLIIVRWNSLESILNICLLLLMGMKMDDDKSHVLFAHMAFPQRVSAFSALVEILTRKDEDSRRTDQAKEISKELERLNTTRNTVVHHNWINSEQGVSRFNVSARGKLKIETKLVSLSELEKISADIELIITKLFTFCGSTLPDMPPTKGAIAKALTKKP